MSSRTLLVVVLAVVFGLSAGTLVYFTVNREPGVAEQEKVKILVAKEDIPGQVLLTPDRLTEKEFPVDMRPPEAFTVEQLAELTKDKDRMTKFPILQGEPITARKLTNSVGLLGLLEKGFVAKSIPVQEESTAIGGWVKPNDFVDVQFTIRTRGQESSIPGGAQTATLLRNVKVLAVGDTLSSESLSDLDAGTKKNARLRHVTVMVKPEEANMLTLGAQEGQLSLVLRRPDEDPENAPPVGKVTLNQLIGVSDEISNENPEFQDQLAELEERFMERLQTETDRFNAILAERAGNEGVDFVDPTGMRVERPQFFTIHTLRGSQRSKISIQLPGRGEDGALVTP